LNETKKYLEFEHKYLISEDEFVDYLRLIAELKPDKSYQVSVTDWYFLTALQPDFIYRYRRDKDYNQLTVKSLQKDSECRLEVNLNLAGQEDCLDEVRAFLSPLSLAFEGCVKKDVHVFYFEDCECVCYRAKFKGTEVLCLELEVRHPENHREPRDVLSRYERKLGLDSATRCPKSLFQLLIEPLLAEGQP
jgi:hypothetical protein